MLLRAENDSIRQKIATVSGKLMLKEGSPSIKTRKTKALGAVCYHFLFFKTMNLAKLPRARLSNEELKKLFSTWIPNNS